MIWRAACILALALACGSTYAQTVGVSGYVSDAESGDALTGANVYAGGGTGAVTDAYGYYRLALPEGRVVLRISFVGYRTHVDTLTLSDDLRLDVALRPVPYGLDAVEVTGARDEPPVESPLMSTVRLPVEEAGRLPAFLGEIDLIKTLQLLPGIQSGTEGTTGLYVRGGGPDQNLVLLDGAPIYNPGHVFGFLSVFNPGALHDARLIKGAFPARYGGRLSSVVDLQTRQGSAQTHGLDGAVGLLMSSLSAEGPLLNERATFLVTARRTYIDVLAGPFLRRRLEEGQRLTSYFYDANARFDYRVSNRSRIALSLYGGQDVYGFADRTTPGAGTTEHVSAASDWANTMGVLRWKTLFSSRLHGSAALVYSRYRFDILQELERTEVDEGSLAEQVEYGSGITDWSLQLDVDYRPAQRHFLRFGTNVTRHGFNPGVSTLSVRASGEQDVDSTLTPGAFPFSGIETYVYGEDDVTIGRRWKANIGLHGSAMFVNGTSYVSLQPRVSARYLIRPDWSVKASFGTMQQYLHLLTNTGLNLPTDLWVAATERVGPQRAWQAALGTDRDFGSVYVSLEGYLKRMHGLIEYEPGASFVVPGEDWQEKVVSGRGRSYGLELLVRKQIGRMTGWLGYTLSWSRRRFDALNNGDWFPYRYDRRHDVALVFSYRWSDRLDVGATWVYGTGQAITVAEARFADARILDADQLLTPSSWSQLRSYGERGGYRMAPYHRLDLVLNWHFDSVLFVGGESSTLSVGAYNAYNRLNPFYLFESRRPDGARVFKQASLFPVLPFLSYRFHL